MKEILEQSPKTDGGKVVDGTQAKMCILKEGWLTFVNPGGLVPEVHTLHASHAVCCIYKHSTIHHGRQEKKREEPKQYYKDCEL